MLVDVNDSIMSMKISKGGYEKIKIVYVGLQIIWDGIYKCHNQVFR